MNSSNNSKIKDSGNGYLAWETRRANLFQRALRTLSLANADADELLSAAHEVSEQLAAGIPESIDSLPRGYSVRTTKTGERSLEYAGVLFSPSIAEPTPDAASIARFGADLKTGLLQEIRAQIAQQREESRK